MNNPRMIHEFDELFTRRVTTATDSSIPYERNQPHGTSNRYAPVKFTGEKQVGLCADGDAPFGSLERVEADGSAVVTWLGSVIYKGTATPDSPVVGDGNGAVRDAGEDAGRGVVGSANAGRVIVFQ